MNRLRLGAGFILTHLDRCPVLAITRPRDGIFGAWPGTGGTTSLRGARGEFRNPWNTDRYDMEKKINPGSIGLPGHPERGRNWKTEYKTSATTNLGAELLVIVHGTNKANEYLFASAPSPGAELPEPSPVPPRQARIPTSPVRIFRSRTSAWRFCIVRNSFVCRMKPDWARPVTFWKVAILRDGKSSASGAH